MGYNQIHETVVSDIFDTMRDGIRLVGDVVNPKTAKVRNARSIARATSGLTLAFPVICTNTLPLETATMIAKAIERKNVSLLQLAFSAYNITSDTDAISHLSKFHQNLNLGKMDLDKFMDAMETLSESAMTTSMISEINAVKEDCKRNLGFVLDDSINPVSLLEYSEDDTTGVDKIVRHKVNIPRPTDSTNKELTDDELQASAYGGTARNPIGPDKKDAQWYIQQKANQTNADNKYELDRAKVNADIIRNNNDSKNNRRQARNDITNYFTKQLLPSDIKKANEMQPTLMIVNFYVNDRDRELNIAQQFVCGVKSKLYAVDSSDIINKIITKHVDSDILLKLVKVSTREISFVKDFLLGLDDAKLDTLSKSRKGSGSTLFKALERRALKGKVRRSLRLENSAKAISTLVISSEEADELKKYNNIDITSSRVVAPIMEKLNLLYFVIVDNTSESISILTDGETEFESYSFTALERESGDAAYKKAINLITKVV